MPLSNPILFFCYNSINRGREKCQINLLIYFFFLVLEYDHAPVTQEYLKRGAPRSLRAQLWIQVLGVDVKANVSYFSTFS